MREYSFRETEVYKKAFGQAMINPFQLKRNIHSQTK
jgi:hypothetical protein